MHVSVCTHMHAQVRDAGCLQVYALPEFQYLNLFLSGIQAPRAPFNKETDESEPQPFYHEASNALCTPIPPQCPVQPPAMQ